MFTVYTYFGRVLATFKIPDSETHHNAMESARKYLEQYERDTGKPAWLRYT